MQVLRLQKLSFKLKVASFSLHFGNFIFCSVVDLNYICTRATSVSNTEGIKALENAFLLLIKR